jgi:hypothetical protein
MGSLCVKLPKRVAIQDWPVEAHTQFGKLFSKREHRSKRRHLVRVSDALPYANIVHSVVRVVDSDVVGEISGHATYPALKARPARAQLFLHEGGPIGFEFSNGNSNDWRFHVRPSMFRAY